MRHSLFVAFACAVVSNIFVSCNEPPVEKTCTAVRSQALVGALPESNLLHLGDRQRSAIGVITSELAPRDYYCTATLVTPNWAISAAHCDRGGDIMFHLAPGTQQHVGIAAEAVVHHPKLDLLLIALPALPVDIILDTIPWVPAEVQLDWIGSPVELAGYGDTSEGPSGALLFVAEEIFEITDDHFSVDGHGISGACGGDSGSPLLTRSVDGTIRIAGVLSKGSASCTGIDEFVRLDRQDTWIREHIGVLPSPAHEACNGFTTAGKCFDEVAVWCRDNELVMEPCDAPVGCGWDADVEGFRCGLHDSCNGLGSFGHCVDDVALYCDRGTPVEMHCDECDATCQRSPASGAVTCSGQIIP